MLDPQLRVLLSAGAPDPSLPAGADTGISAPRRRWLTLAATSPSLMLWTAMKEDLLAGTLGVSSTSELEEAVLMLHAGLDLSRKRLDVCLIGQGGELVGELAVPPDADGLRGLACRLAGQRVRAVIESI